MRSFRIESLTKPGERAVIARELVRLEGLIAAEKLVATVAAQHDLHVFGKLIETKVERENRRIRQGLVEDLGQLLHQLQHFLPR